MAEFPPSSYVARASKLWPWLSLEKKSLSDYQVDDFYNYTYAYAGDDWGERIAEGADSDECPRMLYVYQLCLEFGLDGKNGRPSLSSVWKDIHQYIVCPLFKKAISEDLHERYLSYPSKVWKLDRIRLEVLWKHIDEVDEDVEERTWITSRFCGWVLEDREYQLGPAVKELKAVLEAVKPLEKEKQPKLPVEKPKVKSFRPKISKPITPPESPASKTRQEAPAPAALPDPQPSEPEKKPAAPKKPSLSMFRPKARPKPVPKKPKPESGSENESD